MMIHGNEGHLSQTEMLLRLKIVDPNCGGYKIINYILYVGAQWHPVKKKNFINVMFTYFLIGGFKSWFCVVSFYVKTIVRPTWTTKEWKIVRGPTYRFDL